MIPKSTLRTPSFMKEINAALPTFKKRKHRTNQREERRRKVSAECPHCVRSPGSGGLANLLQDRCSFQQLPDPARVRKDRWKDSLCPCCVHRVRKEDSSLLFASDTISTPFSAAQKLKPRIGLHLLILKVMQADTWNRLCYAWWISFTWHYSAGLNSKKLLNETVFFPCNLMSEDYPYSAWDKEELRKSV